MSLENDDYRTVYTFIILAIKFGGVIINIQNSNENVGFTGVSWQTIISGSHTQAIKRLLLSVQCM